jgi:hypothetical protein
VAGVVVTLELWQIITLLLAFFGCVAGFGKVLVEQFERRQAERFAAHDQARAEGQRAMRDIFDQHLNEERRNANALQALERDFLRWQADLPVQYVRREDYVRGQVIIEAKLDGLYNKLEVVQLKGMVNA